MKIILTLILLIFACQISFGQEELAEGEYWNAIGLEKQPIWEYKYFTKEDVITANKQLILLKKAALKNEWEGQYYSETGLGESVIFWNENIGFVKYNFYHTLKILYYGQIQHKEDSIILSHEISPKSLDKKVKWKETFVKVKLGKQHLLVPQSIIKDFCEFIVGRLPMLEVENIRFRYFYKASESENDSSGLAILPETYKHFLVYPIKGKIKEIGKRKIQRSKNWEGKIETDGVKYFVTLNVGKKDMVKKDTEFYIPELKEFATVEKVFQNTSTASIFRKFDEKNEEICEDMDYESTPFYRISVGMSAKTQNRFTYF